MFPLTLILFLSFQCDSDSDQEEKVRPPRTPRPTIVGAVEHRGSCTQSQGGGMPAPH